MRLSRAGGVTNLAPALPMPYPALSNRGFLLRRGQTSLTVAAPGVGKSVLWLNLALRMRVPTMIWSADTDQHDVTMRTLAALTGYTMREAEQYVDESTPGFNPRALLAEADHISWVFEPDINDVHVQERLKAFAEVRGLYPELVVIDNLSNTVQNQLDEYAELRQVTRVMQRIARATNAHVAMLHHALGEYENGDKPIPQGGALGKLAKIPEQMLTLFRAGDDQLGVAIVKNRSGKADPSGRSSALLPVDYSRASVFGFAEAL
jgi:replicative DNA helicase